MTYSPPSVLAPRPSGWAVPAYTTHLFFPKRSEYCVCVFVINEGDRIRRQLQKLSVYADRVDLFVADGGSTDGSLDHAYLRDNRVCGLLTKTGPGRLSAQMRMAFDYALRAGYKGVIIMDGNDKDGPEAIPTFLLKLKEGYDHIQGSRFVPGGHAIRTPFARLLGLKLLHAPLLSLAAGYRYTDTTNGFRAYSARLLQDPQIAVFRDVFQTYELHYHLAIEAARKGFRVTEIPVTRTYPLHGKTPTKISGLHGNSTILRILWRAVWGAYRLKKDHV